MSQPVTNSGQRTILTVEDDDAIRCGIVDALTFNGFRVLEAADGTSGLQKATGCEWDLMLLDLALPGMSGLDILADVRKSRPTSPVIILTAKGDEADRVEGLRRGADDYVVKPFGIRELMARIEAVLRRSPARAERKESIEIPGGVADFQRRELRFDDESRVELSERESELLSYLVAHSGRAISRTEILSCVWHLDPQGISTRTIDMHVARLRDKLGDPRDEPKVILTVRGKGYMYAGPRPSDGSPSSLPDRERADD